MSIENASGFIAFDAIDTLPDPRVRAALESLVAQMNAMLGQQHNGDGSHANVTFALGSATAYLTGAGIWMGQDTSRTTAPWQFRAGDPAGEYVAVTGGSVTINGTVNITGGNAAKKDLTNVTGNYAASSSVGGPATRVVGSLTAAPSGSGLYLGSDYLGYYNGSAWKTYMDSSGNFYLGGTSGALQWNGSSLVTSFASGKVTLDSSGITLGDFTSNAAYVAGGAVKFTRPTASQFSQTGDHFGVYALANGSDEDLYVDNTIVGNTTSSGKSSVYLMATGWNNSGGGSATTATWVRVRSEIGVSAIQLNASSVSATVDFDVAGATTVNTLVHSGQLSQGTAAAGNNFSSINGGTFSSGHSGTGVVTHFQVYNANGQIGSITTSGTTTAYNTTSDATLKVDLGPVTDCKLGALAVKNYEWLSDGTQAVGVFAQDAFASHPEAVTPGDEKTGRPWMVDYSKFVPDLIVGWQGHDTRLQDHDTRLAALEARVATIAPVATDTTVVTDTSGGTGTTGGTV